LSRLAESCHKDHTPRADTMRGWQRVRTVCLKLMSEGEATTHSYLFIIIKIVGKYSNNPVKYSVKISTNLQYTFVDLGYGTYHLLAEMGA